MHNQCICNVGFIVLYRYSHSINLEFYHDILTVLDSVIKKHQLTVNEQLCCIKTIFVILSGQGTVINIDPVHFYSHLYKVIPELDCCTFKTYQNLSIDKIINLYLYSFKIFFYSQVNTIVIQKHFFVQLKHCSWWVARK